MQEISKDLVEFKHKQSELMKHKSGVERKKMLTENEKRRIQEIRKGNKIDRTNRNRKNRRFIIPHPNDLFIS